MQDLGQLGLLRVLRYLNLSGCTGVGDLAPLVGLSHLKYVHLTGCIGVQDVRPLAVLSQLATLNLSQADLSGARLTASSLQGAWLQKSIVCGADLTGTDLSRADLRGALLQQNNFSGATLSGADLGGVCQGRSTRSCTFLVNPWKFRRSLDILYA